MVEFIVDKFNEIIFKACERYGKEEGLPSSEIQVLFYLDEEGEVCYKILKKYTPFKDVTFNEILNVKIDFKGYSLLVPPFIKKTIIEFSEQVPASPLNLNILCVAKENRDVNLFLYNQRQALKEIKLEEL